MQKATLFSLAAVSLSLAAEKKEKKDGTAELFATTNVWPVHLKFEKADWDKMQPPPPTQGGFGRGPGGPGGMGPGMFLAPALVKEADQNKDSKISKEELGAAADKWFTAWDKENKGALKEDQIKEGLNTSLPAPAGPPGFSLQGKEGKRNGLASSMLGVEFEYVKGSLEFGEKQFTNVAIRYKGNGTFMQSRMSDKKSMKIDLNEFVKGQKYKGVSKLNFHNCVTDASYMNEVLSYRLYRDAGLPAARTAYARVSATVPGKWDKHYLGVYSMVENVDENFANDHLGSKKAAIFKPVTPKPFEYLGEEWAKYNQTYDPKTELTREQEKRVIDFAKLVTNGSDEEFAAKLPEFLDFDNAARYFAVTVWLSTLDSVLGIGQNYYMYLHPDTKKFGYIPWDLDHSFGQFFLMGTQDQREKLDIFHPWNGENQFLERLFKHEGFRKQYVARMEEFSKTIFQPERIQKQVDEVAAAIRTGVQEESADKLSRFDRIVSGETFGAKPIKQFVVARAASVNDQLSGKVKGETLGGGMFGPGGGGGGGGNRQGPGNFLAGGLRKAWDKDANEEVSKAEMRETFEKWFTNWDKDNSNALNEDQIKEGLNKELAAFRPGPPGGGPRP